MDEQSDESKEEEVRVEGVGNGGTGTRMRLTKR